MEVCCTCATLLSSVPRFSEAEKALPSNRRLECCTRVICGNCIHKNTRFRSYCPYCQISSPDAGPSSSLLPQGLRDPPSYYAVVTANPGASPASSSPPPYTPLATSTTPPPRSSTNAALSDLEKAALVSLESKDTEGPDAEDTLHFLDHAHDTVTSLSLRYGVPAAALRRANNLGSDHLLAGRRTVLIPGSYYKRGISLSPRPVEGEEEEARKAKIRRWMVTCKVADYEVAVFYLEQTNYDFHDAVEAYFADEVWERDHPLDNNDGRTGKSRRIGRLSLVRGQGTIGGLGGSRAYSTKSPL